MRRHNWLAIALEMRLVVGINLRGIAFLINRWWRSVTDKYVDSNHKDK